MSAGPVVYQIGRRDNISVMILQQNNELHGRRPGAVVLDLGPSGNVEPEDGTFLKTAQREAGEELNIKLKIDPRLIGKVEYPFEGYIEDEKGRVKRELIQKTRLYFMARIYPSDLHHVFLSEEHTNFWMMGINEARGLSQLKPGQKEVLVKLEDTLKEDMRKKLLRTTSHYAPINKMI